MVNCIHDLWYNSIDINYIFMKNIVDVVIFFSYIDVILSFNIFFLNGVYFVIYLLANSIKNGGVVEIEERR